MHGLWTSTITASELCVHALLLLPLIPPLDLCLLCAEDVSVTAAAGLAQQVSDTADEAPATFIKPAHPFDRPRLNLKPRSQPLEIGAKEPQAAQESDLEAHRRRLQLQPRSLPLPAAMPAKEADHRPRRLQLQARTKPLAGKLPALSDGRLAGM